MDIEKIICAALGIVLGRYISARFFPSQESSLFDNVLYLLDSQSAQNIINSNEGIKFLESEEFKQLTDSLPTNKLHRLLDILENEK